MKRILGGGGIALLLMLAVVLAVFAASRMGEWTNPFGAPYRTVAGPVPIGGPFTLTGPDGHAVDDTAFRGKWMLVYFGYTHCPDECPTALNNIGAALTLMGRRRNTVAPVFITVDPARDTPSILGDYTRQFSPQLVGLTGTDASIKQTEHEYRVYSARHPTPGGGYSMDHSSVIYVMDPAGRFAGVIDASADARTIAAQVEKLEA